MFPAILAGIAAGALWGLTFIAPRFIGTASAADLVMARFACYGAISALWLIWQRGAPLAGLGPRDWLRLIALGALGNSLYYLLTVFAVRAGSAGLAALIVGTLPVMFAIAGNLLRPALPWPRLALALAPIAAGLALLAGHGGGGTIGFTVTGALLALAAMASWLAYGLMNAAYLGGRPAVSALDWAALVGIGTALTLPLVGLAALAQGEGLFATGAHGPLILWGIGLGVLSSGLATWLWNIASARVPAAALGYLIVSETLFALVYAFALDARLPTATEGASIALLLGGTLAGLRATRA